MDNTILWQNTLKSLEQKLSKPSIATWFKNVSIVKQTEKEVVLSVPNIFVKEWLQNKFSQKLLSCFQQSSPDIKRVKFVISNNNNNSATTTSKKRSSSSNKSKAKISKISQPEIEFRQSSGLNPKYTFENFVIGDFNQLAYACAAAITRKISSSSKKRIYNPLFVYSKVGLGKTHLLEAIGNEIINIKKTKKVKYIPCPNFTSQVISAIRNQDIENIIKNYNSFDLLIIDDIEFLAGKEKTQEIFFRIFNELTEKGKQIVLSSDRPPQVIENLEERIRSRLGGGMVTDINQPSFEERVAIIEKKLEDKKETLPKEIIDFIAQHIKKNIREIEGALVKAVISYETTRSFEETKKQLKDVIETPKKKISPGKVIGCVSDFYDIPQKEILSQSRKKELVTPRQLVMYLLREEVGLSLTSIGMKVGNRDHTTVKYGIRKAEENLRKNREFLNTIEVIKERIYNT